MGTPLNVAFAPRTEEGYLSAYGAGPRVADRRNPAKEREAEGSVRYAQTMGERIEELAKLSSTLANASEVLERCKATLLRRTLKPDNRRK
jgi:hypothetical protein